MPNLDIRVHRCDQVKPAFEDVHLEAELVLDKAVILEAGMGSGEPSVSFLLTDPETGKTYVAQTSAGILNMLMSAIRGAQAHWLENPVKNIWKE